MAVDARLPVDPGGDLPFNRGPTVPTRPARRRGRAGVDRASAADVMELVCDVSGTSMQVAVVLVLQGRVDLDAARQGFDDRIRAVPRLRQHLVRTPFGCGRQVWVDDPDFDIASHVRSVPCPAPGDEQALLDVVADVVTHRLPPAKPLWAATVITGLSGERTAVVVVFHHVLSDGIGGLAILGRLADGAIDGADPSFPRRPPNRRELLLDAIGYRARAIGRLPAALGRFRSAATELGTRSGPTSAPRCSLNRPIGQRRALAVVHTDLEAVQAIAHARGCTGHQADARRAPVREVRCRRFAGAGSFHARIPKGFWPAEPLPGPHGRYPVRRGNRPMRTSQAGLLCSCYVLVRR